MSPIPLTGTTECERLKATNCHYVAPGVESWADYSNKAGVGTQTGRQKLDGVVAQFLELGPRNGNLQVFWSAGIGRDERQVDIGLR